MTGSPVRQTQAAVAATATRRFSALLYCARSGSTFLAHRLGRVDPRVAVVPEFRLPLLLLWKSEDEVRALGPEALLALMRDDLQFDNLGLPDHEAREIAARVAGRPTREVIEAVVDAHLRRAGHADCAHVVLKISELALNGERAVETFPEFRGLHVVRDPRGVANSMLRARSPYNGNRPMAQGNVLHAARLWLRYLSRVETLSWPVLDIAYERLVEAPDAEAARAAAWLTADAADVAGARAAPPDGDAPRGGFRVGDAERDLHRLAARDGATERTEAWTTELAPWQIAAVESVAGAEMMRRGYVLQHGRNGAPPPLSLRGRFHDAQRKTAHYLGSAARLIGWALADRRAARIRLRQFAARLRGRN